MKILNEHEAQIFNDVLKFMKIDFSHSKAYLLSGSEGKCLIIAEDVSIESAESVDDWFTKSVNSPLKTGYFSPIEIEDFSTQIIQQLQEKEF